MSNQKKLIRERMAKTGESYQSAHRHILADTQPSNVASDPSARENTLKPGIQWVCDECKQLIATPKDGWLEWLADDQHRAYQFRIVHHLIASPRHKDGGHCYAPQHPRDRSSHLDVMLGNGGVLTMLDILELGVVDKVEWAEVFKRLFMPYYEEGRLWPKGDSGRSSYDRIFGSEHGTSFEVSAKTLALIEQAREAHESE